jgi:hypothetical protein
VAGSDRRLIRPAELFSVAPDIATWFVAWPIPRYDACAMTFQVFDSERSIVAQEFLLRTPGWTWERYLRSLR